MAIMVVPMIVPWFGGILSAAFGWEAIFASMGVMAALVLAWIAYALPETLAARSSTGGFVRFVDELRALCTSRSFIGYVLCCATGSALFFGFLGGAPHVVVTLMGRSSVELGLWFATRRVRLHDRQLLLGAVVAALWRRCAWCGGASYVGLLGALLVVTLTLTVPHWGPVTIFLPQFITAFGNGLLLPNCDRRRDQRAAAGGGHRLRHYRLHADGGRRGGSSARQQPGNPGADRPADGAGDLDLRGFVLGALRLAGAQAPELGRLTYRTCGAMSPRRCYGTIVIITR